ncbi:hypothetical protein HHI36_012589 [Cryptolaemus montrouzieri]|uniref:Uncharacterized protein n=1 Tax=Cryptolaemus montrouzieri TaxID=559131 RepID=A0ABD2NF09_9CUCU
MAPSFNKSKYENNIYKYLKNRSCDYYLRASVELLKHKFDFTVPHVTDSITWVVPVPQLVPRWKYIIEMLTIEVLSIWFLTSVATVFTLYLVNFILYNQRNYQYLLQKCAFSTNYL